LVVCLSLAVAFISLAAIFAAGIQLLVFAGLMALLLRAMPQTSTPPEMETSGFNVSNITFAGSIAGTFFVFAISAIHSGDLPDSELFVHHGTASQSLERTGHLLFTWHMGSLHILAFVILVGIIGAWVITRRRSLP